MHEQEACTCNVDILGAWIWYIHLSKFFKVFQVSAFTSYWSHDDVIKRKHFLRNWPFVWGIHRSLVNSPHKGQWCRIFMFSLICARIYCWVNNREAGDLRCHHAHYEVIVMWSPLKESISSPIAISWLHSWKLSTSGSAPVGQMFPDSKFHGADRTQVGPMSKHETFYTYWLPGYLCLSRSPTIQGLGVNTKS